MNNNNQLFDDDSFVDMDMPDFDAEQERYIRAVRRGRHPNSFKRKSELWYYANLTGARVDRVAKGHRLSSILSQREDSFYGSEGGSHMEDDWTFHSGGPSSLDEQKQNGAEDDQSVGDLSMASTLSYREGRSGSSFARMRQRTGAKSCSAQKSRASTRESTQSTGNIIHDVMAGVNIMSPKRLQRLSPVRDHTPVEVTAAASAEREQRELINFSLNGVHIDVRNNVPLNYGMLVVLMNEQNHVLCVDKWGHLRIKSKQQLLFSDRMCFKLVDLREYHNPGEITYGQPLWLQIVETPVEGAQALSFFRSEVLSSKVFGLETIQTQQLDASWEKNEKRVEIIKREEPIDSDEEYDKRQEEEERKREEERQLQEAVMNSKRLRKGRRGGWGTIRVSKGNINKMAKANKKEEEKKKKMEEEEKKKKEAEENGEHMETTNIGSVTGAATKIHLALNEHVWDDQPPDPRAVEIVSKEALNLGCWQAETAENDLGLEDEYGKSLVPQFGDPLLSNKQVILTQDLYCLADSQGSNYLPWPLNSNDYDMNDQLSVRVKKLKEKEKRKREREIAGLSMSLKSDGEHRRKGIVGSPDVDPEFGVIRQIVRLRRGKDYSYCIDSRCMWRFGVIEALEDSSKLTQAELHRAKVMNKAKEILRNSELHRKGKKIYHGSHTHPDETGYVPPSVIKEKQAVYKAAKKAADDAALLAREEHMEREIRETFGVEDEEGSPKIEKDGNDTKEGEAEGSPSLGSLMPTIEVHKTPVLDTTTQHRPEIPGGEKFSLMLRKNTANHLRKREEHLLEARRYKEDPHVSQNYFHDKLTNWDHKDEDFPDDVASMVSTLSFDYVHRRKTCNGEGHISFQPAEEKENEEERGTKAKVMLPINHEKIYEDRQRKILKQKTLVLKRDHYRNYPNFHKDPAAKEYDSSKDILRDPTALEDNRRMYGDRFAFNDHCLSPGEKIFSLRQTFDDVSRGDVDVQTANNGRDDSSIDPRYTTVVRTPMTPGTLEKSKLFANDDESSDKDTETLRREKEEVERASSIAAKMAVLKREDQVILQALQHHKREKVEAELKEMAANWSEEMKRYDAEKEKSKPT